jgi:SAM-dependent methyltransferase
MRVLDLGTGLGHVAFELAELVGERGEVVGVDASREHLEAAESRRIQENVSFVQGDARTYEDGYFDAVVARLLLFHLPDPLAALRHHARHARRIVALDFDVMSVRTEPRDARYEELTRWVADAFRAGGADPEIGAKLPRLLTEAGLGDVDAFSIQRSYAPGDLAGVRQLQAVVASLGGPDTSDLRTDRSVFIPALTGAWGTR